MEQARLEISNDRLNKPGGFLQSATLSMHTNMLLPQYSHFPSQVSSEIIFT
ncbi:unnamed protein product [Trichobilharzia regenti]|nr:unnamed protein product [Trichobilharzia regenti]